MAIGSRAVHEQFGAPTSRGRPIGETRRTASGLFNIIFIIGLIFITGAFTAQLESSRGGAGAAVLQIVTLLTGVFGVGVILASADARRFAFRCWPVLILVVLAFASTPLSFIPAQTLKKSFTLLCTVSFVLAIATKLSPMECIRLVVRVMVLECLLSLIWVVVFPDIGIQNRTGIGIREDEIGEWWRGIFSHKQGLGVVAGLAIGLIGFYGRSIFGSLFIRVGAILCCLACLIGARSATGILVAIVIAGALYSLYYAARSARGTRQLLVNSILIGSAASYFIWSRGYFQSLPELFGRSSDLTGRDVAWTIAMDVFDSSGVKLTGGGYAVGIQHMLPEFVYVDNGYYDMLMQFGYIGAAVIVAFICWTLFYARKLIVRTPRELAMISVFPLAILLSLAVLNISEALFLSSKNICTVFTVLAVTTIVRVREQLDAGEKRKRGFVRPNPAAVQLLGSHGRARSVLYGG